MKFRVLSIVLSLAALQWAGTAWAQKGPGLPPVTAKPEEVRDSVRESERQLAAQFKEFQKQVAKLQQRLAKSPKREDQDRARLLEKVIEKAQDPVIAGKFIRLNQILDDKEFGTIGLVKESTEITQDLTNRFGELVKLYNSRSNSAEEEMKQIEQILKAVNKAIDDEKMARAQTERAKTEAKELAKIQNDVTKQAEKIAKALDKKDGKDGKDNKKAPGEAAEAKDTKSDAKDGGKSGENKKAEAKDGGKKNPGEAKESPKDKSGKDSKPGEAKASDKTGKENKAPENKDGEAKKGGKSSENKDANAKDSKGAKGSQGEAKDAKAGEKKPADAKDAGKKNGAPPQAKEAGEAKGAKKEQPKASNDKKDQAQAKDSKNADNKAGAKDSKEAKNNPDAKQAEAKDAGKDSKQGEAKSGDPKSGQKSPSAKSPPGQPKDQGSPPQAKGDNNKQQPPPPPAGDKDQPLTKKKIQDVIEAMKKAEKKIADGKNKEASPDQKDAIDKLQELKKELEKRLLQLREEEMERLLAKLKDRCEKMLAMQIEVLGVKDGKEGTIPVFEAIQATTDKKPIDKHRIASAQLSNYEKDIVNEMVRFRELLESEGSAAAFPEAASQVLQDMKHVQRRLDVTDVGPLTQAIEEDIIASLKDMVAALDKKIDNQQKKKKDKQAKPGEPKQGPQADPKLLEQIAELKMIRAMQIRLNTRTKRYADLRLNGQEQSPEAAIQQESRDLAERQDRIFDITRKIAQGDNK